MVLVSSTMVELSQRLPAFTIVDALTALPFTATEVNGERGLLVAFISAECPYVLHVLPVLDALAREFAGRGIGCIGVVANDPLVCPEDAPDALAQFVRDRGLGFRVGIDAEQVVARAFKAVCTPDLFLYDADTRLVYRGRVDATRPWTGREATGDDLRDALNALAAGAVQPVEQHPAIGCSIKWRESVADPA